MLTELQIAWTYDICINRIWLSEVAIENRKQDNKCVWANLSN